MNIDVLNNNVINFFLNITIILILIFWFIETFIMWKHRVFFRPGIIKKQIITHLPITVISKMNFQRSKSFIFYMDENSHNLFFRTKIDKILFCLPLNGYISFSIKGNKTVATIIGQLHLSTTIFSIILISVFVAGIIKLEGFVLIIPLVFALIIQAIFNYQVIKSRISLLTSDLSELFNAEISKPNSRSAEY